MPTPRSQHRPDPLLRLHRERRSQLRGLLILGLLAAVFLILRFGPGRVFTSGWWRLW